MPHGPTQFRLTVIKPYYKDDSSEPLQEAPEDAPEEAPEDAPEENHDQRTPEGDYDPDTIVVDVPQPRRGRGRPKGSRNRRHLVDFEEQFVAAIESRIELSMAFITAKEKLLMTTSTFNPCFLISTTGTPFGIVGMQTDDTIIL